MDWPSFAIVAAALGSGVLGSWVTAFYSRRKTAASATSIISAAAASVVETVGRENARLIARVDRLENDVVALKVALEAADHEGDRLRSRVGELSGRVEALHAHIDTLEALMTAQGMTPPPRPRAPEST